MNILITGVSGFIGSRLAERLAARHTVAGMARGGPPEGAAIRWIQGSFDQAEDLRKLDGETIDAVVHLAAVTGGSDEESAIGVNVAGTRRLYRYLLDRGCRRFVTASSIAAVGSLDPAFLPQRLPIPDDHPCLARDAYGLSKSLVEEVVRYLHRTSPGSEFVNLRLGSVVPDESWTAPPIDADSELDVPFVTLARVYASDVVAAIERIVEAPQRDRTVTCNLVGPDIAAAVPSLAMLEALLRGRAGEYDLSGYEGEANRYRPLYDISRLEREFGFAPARSTRPEGTAASRQP